MLKFFIVLITSIINDVIYFISYIYIYLNYFIFYLFFISIFNKENGNKNKPDKWIVWTTVKEINGSTNLTKLNVWMLIL